MAYPRSHAHPLMATIRKVTIKRDFNVLAFCVTFNVASLTIPRESTTRAGIQKGIGRDHDFFTFIDDQLITTFAFITTAIS